MDVSKRPPMLGLKSMDTSFITLKYPTTKWIVLFVCCYSIFTNTYCNNLATLQWAFQEREHLTNLQWGLLYSVYSMPNIVLPIVGGLLIDKLNAELCLILFIFLELVGQLLFALGASVTNYFLIILGRVFYGLGGECVHVASYAMIGIYFDGSYVAFAMGLRQSMGRFGASTNNLITQYLFNHSPQCISCSIWVGFGTLFLAFFISISMYLLLRYYQHKILGERTKQIMTVCSRSHTPLLTSISSPYASPNPNLATLTPSKRAEREHEHSISNSSAIPINYGAAHSSSYRKRSSFRLRDIHDFNAVYWLLNICCCLFYCTTLSWNIIAQTELHSDFALSYNETDELLTLFFSISGVCGPFIGYLADRIGRKCQLIILCAVLVSTAHVLLYCFDEINGLNALWIVLTLGVGFSIFPAAIFPGIALIVRKKTYGTAYGVVIATFNTALTVVPIIIAILSTQNWKRVEMFFIVMALLAIVMGVLLMFYDKKHGSKLRASPITWRTRNSHS